MAANRKLFLSAVSTEFLGYRELLAQDLKRPMLNVAVQEDFIVTGGSTLEKLDTYIRACDGIVHLIGKATGAAPKEHAVAALLEKYSDFAAKLPPVAEGLSKPQPDFSYSQWEAYLALYHRRPLFVYQPTDFEREALDVPRDPRFVLSSREVQSQRDHYARVRALGHDRGQFRNEERLSSAVLRDLVEILPRLETTIDVAPTRLRHTAGRLIGRDEELARLDAAWNDQHKNLVVVRAFGGMGKTSLVTTWMAELALKNWRGAERVFDWSFYSQGTSDQRAASADTFIAAALAAFGDPDPTRGSAWDRGARLAHLVGKQRCLLVLDGLEPLQYPSGPMEGKLKDAAIEALLKGLVAQSVGLCVVTTRERVPDIQQYYGRTADDIALSALTDLAGAALLHHHGVRRAGAKEIRADDRELRTASREVRGHGLTLQLLGQYLRLVEDGDILKRDTVRLADADREYQNDASRPYGHAFKAMEAYERWFQREGERGQRQLAILRLLGLFDRPASKGCLDALRAAPIITGLTEPLHAVEKAWLGLKRIEGPLSAREWNSTVKRLEEINLLTLQGDGSLDAHPLQREYFGQRVRATQPETWRAAHRRLYEHLCATTSDKKPEPTLEDLQPLYQAVAHGCHAGLQQDAYNKVYFARIMRGREYYSSKKLGALGSSLGAVACFFETPWSRVSPALTEDGQAWSLSEAAFYLRALGRLIEALEPMRAGLKRYVEEESWKEAAVGASNLSDLELTMGDLAEAVGDAEKSVTYANRSGDGFERTSKRTKYADALCQVGRRADAEARFREAEAMQAERDPAHPLLLSLSGFWYCALLLTEAERFAWRAATALSPLRSATTLQSCRAVSERAAQTLRWVTTQQWLLDIALDHLTLGRAALYEAIIARSPFRTRSEAEQATAIAKSDLDSAVDGLRRAGHSSYLPHGLLTRAWLRSLTGVRTGHDSAQADLDEAWEIAERGPMPLHMADIHLHRARLFFREASYPWSKNPDGTPRGPADDLAEARRLIFKHGYLRRKEELEDAEAALSQPRTPSA